MSTATLTAKDKIITFFENRNFKDNSSLRAEGKEVLKNLQVPDKKSEAWKYTNTNFLLKNDYSSAKQISGKEDLSSLVLSADHENYFVVNGYLVNDPANKIIQNIISSDSHHISEISKNFFTALNAEKFTGGTMVNISDNKKSEKIIHIVHLATDNQFSNTRHHIRIGKNAGAEIILSFHSSGENTFSNFVTEIECEENSSLTIHLLQQEGKNAAQYNHIYCLQKNNSRFSINTFTNGGEWVRNDLDIIVNGENCETHLNGLYLPKEKQYIDNHTFVDHKKPNCISNEMYKGVMSDESTGVFNGKVFVRPDAQKINAYQQNANILLSDNATINSKPELEIYADNVKCSHGSTTGQLDEEALFYLRSRGVGEENARKLLVHAFVNEVIERNSNEELRNYLYKQTGLEN